MLTASLLADRVINQNTSILPPMSHNPDVLNYSDDKLWIDISLPYISPEIDL